MATGRGGKGKNVKCFDSKNPGSQRDVTAEELDIFKEIRNSFINKTFFFNPFVENKLEEVERETIYNFIEGESY